MKYIIYTILILSVISCSKDDNSEEISYNPWNGPSTLFVKEAGSDPDLAINQDKITSSVAITRGNSGKEIYNALSETGATKGLSPLGTEWAIGTLSDISSLTFTSFRTAVGSPKNVVGKKLVLHIIAEDVYISVEFKSWGENQNGSFSYERTTEN